MSSLPSENQYIISAYDLNLILEGNNVISSTGNDYGLYVKGKLSISGTGSLQIATCKKSTILAVDDITIADATIKCSNDSSDDAENAIYSTDGGITVKSGNIDCNRRLATSNGGTLLVEGGKIKAEQLCLILMFQVTDVRVFL